MLCSAKPGYIYIYIYRRVVLKYIKVGKDSVVHTISIRKERAEMR
jgi:hypothetical protein